MQCALPSIPKLACCWLVACFDPLTSCGDPIDLISFCVPIYLASFPCGFLTVDLFACDPFLAYYCFPCGWLVVLIQFAGLIWRVFQHLVRMAAVFGVCHGRGHGPQNQNWELRSYRQSVPVVCQYVAHGLPSAARHVRMRMGF